MHPDVGKSLAKNNTSGEDDENVPDLNHDLIN